MAGVLPDVVVLVRVLSRCRSRSLWAVRLQRAVGVCVCCVLFVVRQELLVVVLVPCICRKLARSCVYACHGARCAARFGMRHLGMLGQARDGARGVQAGHVRLQSRAQRASPSTTVRHGAQQNAFFQNSRGLNITPASPALVSPEPDPVADAVSEVSKN